MINDDIAARIAAKAARMPADGERQINAKLRQELAVDLPWLQPATVDPDWLTEARNHSAATREPFTHPLWDVSAA